MPTKRYKPINARRRFRPAAALVAGLVSATIVAPAWARDQIRIVGSSTVFPFSTAVAEQFGRTSSFKTPIVESTGSGGGLKLFCAGIGVNHPDITNASRRIKSSETDKCASNGITEVLEAKIGYDGIVLASDIGVSRLHLSLRDIFLALAKDVPNGEGSTIPNPYKRWNEVNANLPDRPIYVLGPPPTSGTRDAFTELGMEGGCKSFDWIKALKGADKPAYKSLCHTIREDGLFIEAGENDNLIIQKLTANKDALGIFGFGFLDQNSDKVHGSTVDGQQPDFEAIADGSYPLSRSLYMYVKGAHIGVVPGVEEFLLELTKDGTWGDDGYLADKGLIPMPDEERRQWKAKLGL